MATVRHIVDHLNHDALVGGGGEVGVWQPFQVEPGWTSVTLRCRLVPAGLQLEGVAVGSLLANSNVRFGSFPPGCRPGRPQALTAQGLEGAAVGMVSLICYPDPGGEVYAASAITLGTGGQIAVSGILTTDP